MDNKEAKTELQKALEELKKAKRALADTVAWRSALIAFGHAQRAGLKLYVDNVLGCGYKPDLKRLEAVLKELGEKIAEK